MKSYRRLAVAIVSVYLLTACEAKKDPANTTTPSSAKPSVAATSQLLEQLPQLSKSFFARGTEAIAKSHSSAQALQQAIKSFLDQPDTDSLRQAQKAWLQARLDYRGVYLYKEIALVEPDTFAKLNRLDYQIAAYPIQPGYLDAFGEYKYSGLINDIGFPLSKENLENQHGLTDLSDVVLGFHAIEFFLFGYGEEVRGSTDFVQAENIGQEYKERGFEKLEELPNNRRRQLLSLQAEILVEDLAKLKARWRNSNAESTEQLWQQLPKEKALAAIQKSIESANTKLMIEISEINKGELETQNVSTTILMSSLESKQNYIRPVLISFKQNAGFMPSDKKEQIESELDKAISLTEIVELESGTTEKDHWRAVFAHLKQASDLLIQ